MSGYGGCDDSEDVTGFVRCEDSEVVTDFIRRCRIREEVCGMDGCECTCSVNQSMQG